MCAKKNTFHSCFFNFQFSQASLLHSSWLLPFSICPWGGRSYGPCRLRRKGCYSPVTLTRSASSPALIYGHRGGVEVSWCTIGFSAVTPTLTLKLILPLQPPHRPFKTPPSVILVGELSEGQGCDTMASRRSPLKVWLASQAATPRKCLLEMADCTMVWTVDCDIERLWSWHKL